MAKKPVGLGSSTAAVVTRHNGQTSRNESENYFHPDFRRALTKDEEVRLATLQGNSRRTEREEHEFLNLKKVQTNAFLGAELHPLFNTKVRTYLQGCYDDGKYLFLSPNFCNQAGKNGEKRKWVATYDQEGTPVWICPECMSVYPRREK